MPGGVVELGETLRAAAEREVLEETGLVVEAGEVLEVLDRIISGKDGGTQRLQRRGQTKSPLCRSLLRPRLGLLLGTQAV